MMKQNRQEKVTSHFTSQKRTQDVASGGKTRSASKRQREEASEQPTRKDDGGKSKRALLSPALAGIIGNPMLHHDGMNA